MGANAEIASYLLKLATNASTTTNGIMLVPSYFKVVGCVRIHTQQTVKMAPSKTMPHAFISFASVNLLSRRLLQ